MNFGEIIFLHRYNKCIYIVHLDLESAPDRHNAISFEILKLSQLDFPKKDPLFLKRYGSPPPHTHVVTAGLQTGISTERASWNGVHAERVKIPQQKSTMSRGGAPIAQTSQNPSRQ